MLKSSSISVIHLTDILKMSKFPRGIYSCGLYHLWTSVDSCLSRVMSIKLKHYSKVDLSLSCHWVLFPVVNARSSLSCNWRGWMLIQQKLKFTEHCQYSCSVSPTWTPQCTGTCFCGLLEKSSFTVDPSRVLGPWGQKCRNVAVTAWTHCDLSEYVKLVRVAMSHKHLPPVWTSQRLLLPNGSVSSSRATSSPSSRLRSCSWQPLHFLFSWYRRLTGYSASSQERWSSVWCSTSGIWGTRRHCWLAFGGSAVQSNIIFILYMWVYTLYTF